MHAYRTLTRLMMISYMNIMSLCQSATHVTVARVLNLSPLNYPFVDTINRGTVADL